MSEMPAPRYELHREIEDRHWWFVARRKIIISILSRYLPLNAGATVVEVGCGTGGNLAQLKKHYRAIGTEISAAAARAAREKTGCEVYMGENLGALGGVVREVTAVLLLDILEHLHDPVSFLSSIRSSVRVGTLILVTVPAGQWFFSEHDLAFGHLRRYSQTRLEREIRQAGFDLLYISHFNTLLSLPAYAVRLSRRLLLPLRKGKQYKTDFWFPPPPFNSIFKALMGGERYLLGRVSLPWGLSIVAVAVKQEERGTDGDQKEN